MEKVIVNRRLVPSGYNGITIYPFIFAKDQDTANDPTFLNHERIHLKQQIEMLVIPFYLWYVLEYFFRIFQYGGFKTAYRNISMEREAYGNEDNPDYIKHRKFFTWMSYLRES